MNTHSVTKSDFIIFCHKITSNFSILYYRDNAYLNVAKNIYIRRLIYKYSCSNYTKGVFKI